MSKNSNYPSQELPLLPQILVGFIGAMRVPSEIRSLFPNKPPVVVWDLAYSDSFSLPSGSQEIVGEFLGKCLSSRIQDIKASGKKVADIGTTFSLVSTNLSPRAKNPLIRNGITAHDDLSKWSLGELASIRGLGTKSLLELLAELQVLTAVRTRHIGMEGARNTVNPKADILQKGASSAESMGETVKSRKLSQAADSLARKRYASRIMRTDPRLGREVLMLSYTADTAKEAARYLVDASLTADVVKEKIKAIKQLTGKAEKFMKLSLEDEAAQLIALLAGNERVVTVMKARWGIKRGAPATLEETGQLLGVTRERVRQLEAKFVAKMNSVAPVWTPAFDRSLAAIDELLPASEEQIQSALTATGVSKGSLSTKSIKAIGSALGRPLGIELDPRTKMFIRTGEGKEVAAILHTARALVTKWGATNAHEVRRVLAESRILVSEEAVMGVVPSQGALVWLDAEHKWFYFSDGARNRILNYVEKILSVAGSITISELRNGTGRSYRVQGVRLPSHILTELCISTGMYTTEEDRIIGNESLADWNSVLAPQEQMLAKILFDNGYAMRRADLEELATQAGMARNSFYIYITYSPILERYAPSVYGLRGAPVTAAQIDALIPPIVRQHRVVQDYGWMDDGKMWVGYKVSRGVASSGVLTAPRAIGDMIQGSFTLSAGTGEQIGTLTVRDSSIWGLSPFLARWAIEEGDFLAIEFNAKTKTATITAGDSELLSRYQDGEDLPAAVATDLPEDI